MDSYIYSSGYRACRLFENLKKKLRSFETIPYDNVDNDCFP